MDSMAPTAGLLARSAQMIVDRTKALPEPFSDLYEAMDRLQRVVISIHDLVEQRPGDLPSEKSHHAVVLKIMQSCQRSLETLRHELGPVFETRVPPSQKIQQTLGKLTREKRIEEVLSHINQRTTMLQLSLTTMSLGSAQAGTQPSQDQIQAEIRSLTDSVRLSSFSWNHGDDANVSSDPNDDSEGSLFLTEIQEWKKAVDDVVVDAAAPVVFEGVPHFNASANMLEVWEEDDFDPEPELKDHSSHATLELRFEANQDYVRRLVQFRLFEKAVSYQKRGIELREQLHDHKSYDPGEMADMKESLADILLECDTPETNQEGKMILEKLLEEVVQDTDEDPHRKCRLNHKLGAIYLQQNNIRQAHRMLRRAFEGRRMIHPMPRDLVSESAELLIKALQLDHAADEARGLREWMSHALHGHEEHRDKLHEEPWDVSMLYRWCRENGFDVDSPAFGYDILDSTQGTTPLHHAVEKENLEVVADMISQVKNVDVVDNRTGTTPLLLAAAIRNVKIVCLLLDHGANPCLFDHNRMTALHRCQSVTGGLFVAEAVLRAWPGLIDEVDHLSKTALYLACESGNEEMVELLLQHGANPNIRGGPGLRTPLIITLDLMRRSGDRMAIGNLLIRHGADPAIQDMEKRTAWDAAKNARPRDEVMRLLDLSSPAALRRSGVLVSKNKLRASGVKGLWFGNTEKPRMQLKTTGSVTGENHPSVRATEDLLPYGLSSVRESNAQGSSDSGYASGAQSGAHREQVMREHRLREQQMMNELDRLQLPATSNQMQHSRLETAKTIDSEFEASSLSNAEIKVYTVGLVTDLFSLVKPFESDEHMLKRIFEMIPGLLRAFALRLGYKAQTAIHHEVSYFVYKNLHQIQGLFEEKFPSKDEGSKDDNIPPDQFAISRFLKEPKSVDREQIETSSPSHSPTVKVDDDDPESHINPGPDAGSYRNHVANTPAYNWLLANLQRELRLTRATPDLMEQIRTSISSTLPFSDNVGRKAHSRAYKANFELDWDPLSFVKEQKYTESEHDAVERAITLTGSMDDSQGLSAAEYLSQTWPATGNLVMRLVTDVIRNTNDHHASCMLPDGTELGARIEGEKFMVTVIGIGDSLVEIGQQLAWLGAALRSSPFEAGVATCSPFVRCRLAESTASLDEADESLPSAEIFCVIGFNMSEPFSRHNGTLAGQCWHNMFRNPVMVSGYPILTKSEPGLGLEMPLNMMAGLAGSNRADTFDGKVFIKGFSTMLIATRLAKDLLVWHYLYNTEGERISYLDHTLQHVDDIDLSQLDTARHVLGWCADCMSFAGTTNARYDIDRTCLPAPHAGCLLEKVTLSAGSIITGGMTFAVGVKDVPIHLTRNGYILKLKWIATKYVVLWDDGDKRGWLVNGTSALLHLVRASLDHYSKDDFSASFLFDPSKMKNTNDYKPNSASRILADLDNRQLEIYPGRSERSDEEETKQKGADAEESKAQKRKRGYYLLEDLVEQHYNVLEQIIDHQGRIAGRNGVNLKARMRRHLEGWDFVELATDHDPYPRVATLQALGYGWVDFVRSIGAITLFGRGFGDMIRPKDEMCPHWENLPKQQYYLAVAVFDLENIMRKFGDRQAVPLRPVHDLLWHSPEDLVASCQCQRHGKRPAIRAATRGHRDPVQVLYPKRSRLFLPLRGPGKLEDHGAVIFGHNMAWRYRWRDAGEEDLEEGNPVPCLLIPETQPMITNTRHTSASSDGLLNASQACQSRDTTSTSETDSSPSSSLARSTSASSNMSPPDDSDHARSETAHSGSGSLHEDDRARRLRREKRRLGKS